jgi:hypothetical protein
LWSGPNGPFAGEDAIPFANANVEAKKINGRWKVVDGSHFILDFDASEANAHKAVWVIKTYAGTGSALPNPPRRDQWQLALQCEHPDPPVEDVRHTPGAEDATGAFRRGARRLGHRNTTWK